MQTQRICGGGSAPVAVWERDEKQGGRWVHRAQEREHPPMDPHNTFAGKLCRVAGHLPQGASGNIILCLWAHFAACLVILLKAVRFVASVDA